MYSAETGPSPTARQAPSEEPSGRTSAPRYEEGTPTQWHRVLTLLADIGLFVGTRSLWVQAASHRLPVAAVVSLCYASILVTGALTLVVRQSRALARLDLVVLLTAATLAVCGWVMNHGGSDEAVLTALTVRVTNEGGAALRPHFTLTKGQGMSRYWGVEAGPAVLRAHGTARYELLPPGGRFVLPGPGVRVRVRAVSAAPMTLSSTDVQVPDLRRLRP
ncbi:hypothetical protein ACSYGO_33935 [Streptomyces krungchingensis]